MWLSLEVLITRTYKNSIILCLPSEVESRTSSTANKRVTVGRQPKRKYKWKTWRREKKERTSGKLCVFCSSLLFFCLLLPPAAQVALCNVPALMSYIIEICTLVAATMETTTSAPFVAQLSEHSHAVSLCQPTRINYQFVFYLIKCGWILQV